MVVVFQVDINRRFKMGFWKIKARNRIGVVVLKYLILVSNISYELMAAVTVESLDFRRATSPRQVVETKSIGRQTGRVFPVKKPSILQSEDLENYMLGQLQGDFVVLAFENGRCCTGIPEDAGNRPWAPLVHR